MKVIIAIPCLLQGGTEIQTLYLAKALVTAHHSVEIVCYFESSPDVVREFEAAGCAVSLLGVDRGVGFLRKIMILKQAFLVRTPDVIHVQYMAPGAMAVAAARLAGVKNILATVHQPYTDEHGVHAKVLLRAASLLCDYFISVSSVAEQSWFGSTNDFNIELIGKKKVRHFTLHNTVDVEKITLLQNEAAKEEHYTSLGGLLGSDFVFGYVGRLRYEKGFDILVDAFRMVSEKNPEVRLLVVGDGPDKVNIVDKYKNEKCWEKIVFVGGKTWEQAVKYYGLMDVLIVPSRFEGFGLVAIEAMSASIPVIASDAGGLKEVVQNKQSGILFENGNIDELARAMISIYTDGPFRAVLSENAKKRAMDFDTGIYNRKIKELYGVLL